MMQQLALEFEMYTLPEVAGILKAKPDTVRHWRDRGKIDVVVLPDGQIRVTGTELRRILTEGARPAIRPRRIRSEVPMVQSVACLRDYKACASGARADTDL